MAMILDGCLLLVLLIGVIIGCRRGFIKSAVRLIGCLLALVLAFCLSSPLSEWIFDGFFRAGLEQSVSQQLTDAAVSSTQALETQIDGVLETLPALVRNALASYGVGTSEQIGDILEAHGSQSTAAIAETLVSYVIRPVCVLLMQILCFIVLFLVLTIAIRLLGRLLDRMFNLPLIRHVNRLLGGVIGLIEGVLASLVLIAVLQIYITVTGPDALISQDVLRQTTLVSFVADHNFLLHSRVITQALEFWKH